MSALAQEQSTAVQVPESADLARELPSDVLYQLETAGQLATEILDERVVQWTEDGWSQRKIGDELGCSQQAVSKRQARLGVESQSDRGRPRNNNPVVIADPGDPEIVDAEPVPDEPRKPQSVDPDHAAYYLPDLVREDTDDHPRTQAVHWFAQGVRLQGLLSGHTPLTVRSDEDRAAMQRDAAAMASLATSLEEAISNADID